MGIIGPSLIDLETQTHTNGWQISFIFLVRGIFAILASIAFVPVLEHYNRSVPVYGNSRLLLTSAKQASTSAQVLVKYHDQCRVHQVAADVS